MWTMMYCSSIVATAVKQADVVLLGFPLEMPMPEVFRMNDLSFYEKV